MCFVRPYLCKVINLPETCRKTARCREVLQDITNNETSIGSLNAFYKHQCFDDNTKTRKGHRKVLCVVVTFKSYIYRKDEINKVQNMPEFF